MAYSGLTQSGKAFIRKVCAGDSRTLLDGKSSAKYSKKDSLYNMDGHLPFCSPPCPVKTWYSNAQYNGKKINTNQELGEALIVWFNKYSKIFELDANIIAAQAYAESGYNVWAYPLTSTASGISQFITEAVFDVIVTNKYSSQEDQKFTSAEISAITKNLSGNTKVASTFTVDKPQGKKNRATLHQNIIDNPEIMIKGQCCYMKYIGSLCDNLASSALFGYNRGPKYSYPSYTKSIASATDSRNYQMEGIGYVYRIFNLLGNKTFDKHGYFGYDFLKLNEPFDKYLAECT